MSAAPVYAVIEIFNLDVGADIYGVESQSHKATALSLWRSGDRVLSDDAPVACQVE